MRETIIIRRTLTASLLVFALLLALSGQAEAARVRVAVMPWKVNSAGKMDFVRDALSDMLTSRIGSSEGVEVISPDKTRAAAAGRALDDARAVKAGEGLEADYVLYGSITFMGSAVSLDARLVKISDGSATPLYAKGTGMDSVIGMADSISKDALATLLPRAASPPASSVSTQGLVPVATSAPPVESPTPAPSIAPVGDGFIIRPKAGERKPVLSKSKAIKGGGLYVAMVAADLDKDGKKELFIVRDNSLVVARSGPKGLDIIKEIKAARGVQNIALAAIDSDGDGREEVFVSSVFDNRPRSSVVEFVENDYKVTVTGIKWLMKTARTGASARVLIGQRYRERDGFYGGLVKLRKEAGKVVEAGPLGIRLPRRVDIYRFEVFDLDRDGSMELVSVDRRSRLRVYKSKKNGGWTKGWKSRGYYGGTLNRIEVSLDDPSLMPPDGVPVEGRFFHMDLDNNGAEELIIKSNTPGGIGRVAERRLSFVAGRIHSLSGDASYAEYITEEWKTKELGGYIADFLIDDLDGDGKKELTVLLVEGTNVLSATPKSYILSYRLNI